MATMDPKEPVKRGNPLGPSWEEVLEEQEKLNPPSDKDEEEDDAYATGGALWGV